MALVQYTPLNALTLTNDSVIIVKVRIIRKWTLPTFKNPTQVYSIDMILQDEEGNKIHASCLNRFFVKFERLLDEFSTIIIEKPSLAENNSGFKLFETDYKIGFQFDTNVKKTADLAGSPFGFDIEPFPSMLEGSTPNGKLVDFIGYVYTYFPIEDVTVKKTGKQTKKMNFQLADLQGNYLYVTFWDKFAIQLQNYIQNNPDAANVVILLQFDRYTFDSGKASVSNCFDVSRLFINGQDEPSVEFKRSLEEAQGVAALAHKRVISKSMIPNAYDEFCKITSFFPIAEVNGITEVKSAVIVGTIKLIHNELDWYYLACPRCNKKVGSSFIVNPVVDGSLEGPERFEENRLYYCDPCNQKSVIPVTRFKIPISVQDSTGVVTLTMFDKEANKLLKVTAANLREKMPEFCLDIPEEMNILLGKRFAFKIDVKAYNRNQKFNFFGILKMSDDVEIIKKLDSNLNENNPAMSESVTINSIDFPSIGRGNRKDDDSVSIDYATPKIDSKAIVNVDASSVKSNSVKCNSKDLKRNLIQVYDDGDTPSSSSTKPRSLDVESDNVEGDNSAGKVLMIPKIEKP